MLGTLKETFQIWADFLKKKDIDCVWSIKPDKGTAYYNHIMIADRGLNNRHRLTLEEFVDSEHVDTRLIFKVVDLSTAEALDIVNAFDRISGTTDSDSLANRLKDDPEANYRTSNFVNIRSYDELMEQIQALSPLQLTYCAEQRTKAAKARLTQNLA